MAFTQGPKLCIRTLRETGLTPTVLKNKELPLNVCSVPVALYPEWNHEAETTREPQHLWVWAVGGGEWRDSKREWEEAVVDRYWGEGGRKGTRCQGEPINTVYLSHCSLDDSSQTFLPTAPCGLNINQLQLTRKYCSHSTYSRTLLRFMDFLVFIGILWHRYYSETDVHRKGSKDFGFQKKRTQKVFFDENVIIKATCKFNNIRK